MKPHVENLGLDTFPVSQIGIQKSAFWDYQCPPVILELAQHDLPALYQSEFLEIRSMYEDHEALFTDRSDLAMKIW